MKADKSREVEAARDRRRSWWQELLILLIGALLLAWPALVNGGPFFFPDTPTYIRAADGAVVATTGHRTIWSDRLKIESAPKSEAGTAAAASQGAEAQTKIVSTRPVLKGRSIYYGFYLYAAMNLLGGLGTVFLTGLVAAATIVAAVGAFVPASTRWGSGRLLLLLAGLAALTPLPFFVSRLMPDVFAGLMILAVLSLILAWDRLSHGNRLWMLVVAVLTVTFHNTHLMLVLVIMGISLPFLWKSRKETARSITVCLGLAVTAVLGGAAFSAAVKATLGEPPVNPPFLSARLIADGPGYRHLQATCTAKQWALCNFMPVLPQSDSDVLLWSQERSSGLFMAASNEMRRQVAREDLAFALSVLRHRPVEVIQSTLASVGRQASLYQLEHFNYTRPNAEAMRLSLPGYYYDQVRATAALSNTMPVRFSEMLIQFFAAASVLMVISFVVLSHRRRALRGPDPDSRASELFGIIVILVLVANIVICGALSTPHARYSMRLLWLVPLAAVLLGVRVGHDRIMFQRSPGGSQA